MSTLVALLLSIASLQPPSLPPEPGEGQPSDDEAVEVTPPPREQAPPPPRHRRPRSLPPDLQPIPFPLEQRRAPDQAPPVEREGSEGGAGDEAAQPPPARQQRRSIVDLRDPFNRPPPRNRPRGERAQAASRLLLPDLKDPFSPELRRVRSKTLDAHIPNDIRDPFRSRPRPDTPRPPCVRTTEDGTEVQAPRQGKDKAKSKAKQSGKPPPCRSSRIDLRDPFDAEK